MPLWLELAARIAFGLTLVGFGTLLLLSWVYVVLGGHRHMAVKLLSALVVLPCLLVIDSGSGYVAYGSDRPQAIVIEQATEAPDRLFMLFHGYNGSGQSLVEMLGSHLRPHGTVVAFQSGPGGYDNDAILALARGIIDERQPDELVLYGESFGGMVVMDLLRRDRILRPRSIVFNATPSSVDNIKPGSGMLWAFGVEPLLHGGVFSTELLQAQQNQDLRTVPAPEPASNRRTRQAAYERMRSITGPMFSDQLSYMANFRPPRAGEFAGQTGTVSYLRAPSMSDTIVRTTASASVLEKAFSKTSFQEITAASWAPDLHAPTPERPSPVIGALLATTCR